MSAIVEWDVPFSIESTKGTLDLNDDSGPLYLLLQEGCEARRDLRVTVDEMPQADGQINHLRFTSGYEVQLQVSLWEDREQPACAAVARAMAEELMLHLNCMLNDAGRLFWTPTGLGDQRLLDEARLREISAWSFGPAGDPRMTFRFDSPFPYVYDYAQVATTLPITTPVSVENEGNVDFFPVVKVFGPTTAFVLANQDVGESIVYNSALPGAAAIGSGDYVELDFFRNTAFLNGDGANLMAGIDVELSLFWALQAGVPNFIECTGAAAQILYNHAYA